ncbi:MAG: MFS transporter [Bryobacteraceae bacterium]
MERREHRGVAKPMAMITPPPTAAGIVPSRTRWLMISLVFAATVINYLDRQTLSVLAPVLREEFGMSNVTYSRIVSAFMLSYTIMNGVSGPLIDRLGTRIGYALCVLWWSAAAMAHAFSTSALTFGVFRFLLGMGEAGNWPAGIRVVTEWFPVKERALASGIFNSGSSIGALLATPMVVFLSLRFGWRTAFLVVGLSGFVWLLLWWPSYRLPRKEAGSVPPAPPIPVGPLLRTRFVRAFTIAKLFFDPVWYFYIFWFPEYLKSARHFDMVSIGKYGWIPFLAADLGNLIGGWLCGKLIQAGLSVNIARKSAVTVFALCMSSAIPAVFVESASQSIALVSVAMAGYTACNAILLSFPADVFPSSSVGSIWGLASMGSGFGGMLFALITGWVVDHYSYEPVFIGFGLLPLITTGILWFALGPLEPLTFDTSYPVQ